MSLFYSATENRLRCVPRVLLFVVAMALVMFILSRFQIYYSEFVLIGLYTCFLALPVILNKFIDKRRAISLGFCPLSCHFWTDMLLGCSVGIIYGCIILACSNGFERFAVHRYGYLLGLAALAFNLCTELILRGYLLQNFLEGFSKSNGQRSVTKATCYSMLLLAALTAGLLFFFNVSIFFPVSWVMGLVNCFLNQILMSIIFLERGSFGFAFSVSSVVGFAKLAIFDYRAVELDMDVSTGLLLVCVVGCAVRGYRNHGFRIHDNFTCNGYIGASQMATLQDDVEMAGIVPSSD